MADNGLIYRYLAEVALDLPARQTARLLLEFEDHLLEKMSQLVAQGRHPDDAARAAIESFGDPTEIAHSFDHLGGAMPTKFTRWAGLIGIVGIAVIIAGLAIAPRSDTGGDVEGLNYSHFIALSGFFMVLTGFAGIIARTRGAIGFWRGLIAAVLCIGGAGVGGSIGYGVIGVVAVITLMAGLALLFDAVFRAGVLPRPVTLLVVGSGVALVVMSPSDIEKQSWPYYVGGVALLVGVVWLLYTLWSERPETATGPALAV